MKRFTTLLLVAGLIAFIYGCCSHSSSGVFVNPQGDMAITQRTVVIDDLGRLPTVTFPSGASVVGEEENTLQPGIKVYLTEQEISPQNLGYFSEATNIYIERITAFQEPSNPAGSKVYVTTIEKPFKVTIPTNSENGLCYLGIRESETDPWRFQRVGSSDETLANIASFRTSSDIAPKECTFNLHRLSTSFCLVIYNEKNNDKLPETVVDSLFASSTLSIQVKDGKYIEDLKIKGILQGLKLGNINPSDFRARITYRNNIADETVVKINGTSVKQTNKADKTVPGYTHYHTFVVDNITDFSLININGDFNFTLNLKDLETQSFPSGFLIEFFNKIDSQIVLPYYYAEFYKFETHEKQDEPDPKPEPDPDPEPEPQPQPEPDTPTTYSITYNLDGGNFSVETPTSYDVTSATIVLPYPIKEGYSFIGWTSEDITTPQLVVIIDKGSTGDKSFTANWVENPPNTYTLTLNKGTGIDEVFGGGVYQEGEPITATCTVLHGYEFDFWTGNNGEAVFNMPAKDVEMQANAKLINYSITYDWQNGNVVEGNPTSYNLSYDDIVLINPTRTGYSFTGWSGTDLTGENNMHVTIPQGSIGNREYTAHWSINLYKLDLIAGTGIATVDGEGLHEYNSNVLASCTMLAGYQFDSWTGNFTSETFNMPAYNATMTANAKPMVYDITYDGIEGATFASDNPTKYDVTSATITLNNPTKDNYVFLGWTGTDIPSGEASMTVTIPQGSTNSRSYVASWVCSVYTFTLAEGVTLEMRRCPAGTFIMGSPDNEIGSNSNEHPQHQVTISQDFYMGTYEVTQAQWRAIMGNNPSANTSGSEINLPVENVNCEDIGAYEGASEGFLQKINAQLVDYIPTGYKFDLPTEAQWEYACRAGTTKALNNNKNLEYEDSQDSNLDEVAWYKQNWGESEGMTNTVGTLAPNDWGLYDMLGNVEEWCRDGYTENYYQQCIDNNVTTDPEAYNPTSTYHVTRGGNYNSDPKYCRSAYRSYNPWYRMSNYSFRLALVKVSTP